MNEEMLSKISSLGGNPEALANHLSENASGLQDAAPNITQSLHRVISSGVNFLYSKMPKPTSALPLSPAPKYSKTDQDRMSRYYEAIDNPLSALIHVKNGTLSHHTIEALQAVHPELLKEMRGHVAKYVTPEKTKHMSYSHKLSIAKFLGAPLDENMIPQVILSNQQVLNAPSLSQQSAPKSGRKTQPLGPMKNIKFADRIRTQTQKDEEEGL